VRSRQQPGDALSKAESPAHLAGKACRAYNAAGVGCRKNGRMIMSTLEVRNLRKSYSRREVVKGVSFEVDAGEIVGLLGQNGAGKTTAFRMTIGMIPRDGGEVIFNGEDVSRMPMYQRARRGMGYLSQEPSVFQRLTVAENVEAILETLRLRRTERKQRLAELLERLGLSHLARSKAFTLSGGERRRLEITRALVTNPKLILLDEPFSGVDPIAVGDIREIILQLRETGIGILLTDHNVHDTLSVTDRSYIISQGAIEAAGTPEELLENPRARELYLGDRLQIDHLDRPSTDSRPGGNENDHPGSDAESGPTNGSGDDPERGRSS